MVTAFPRHEPLSRLFDILKPLPQEKRDAALARWGHEGMPSLAADTLREALKMSDRKDAQWAAEAAAAAEEARKLQEKRDAMTEREILWAIFDSLAALRSGVDR